MIESAPLLTSSGLILWLKVGISVALLAALYLRYRNRAAPAEPLTGGAKTMLVVAALLSFAVFHNLGQPRSGTFVHYGEMFHYYIGAKYFDELGHYELYKAVIVADAEQGSALRELPFFTDLTTYQNASRASALASAKAVKSHFSKARWRAFKRDVAFFRDATATPQAPGLFFLVMDHGYNASPVSTLVLGALTNLVPVTKLWLLAALDVVLVVAMATLVFTVFGFEMGALFSIFFSVNILNDHGYISGGLLRYDWLFCIVAAVCLLQRRRHAASAVFLTAAAMLKIFPVVLLYGAGVAIARKVTSRRALDGASVRFMVAAGVTSVVLFLLPAISLGSVLEPWEQFSAKTSLHNDGVYVNHLGLRGMMVFEPSHLSLDEFVATYAQGASGDIVRNWQDAKEAEAREKKPLIVLSSLLVLACVTAIVWKREEKDLEIEGILWPLLLIYTGSYPSHYYYTFLCLFVLLFFRRANTLRSFVPLALLLVFNIVALVTDAKSPSPIAFYTLVNIYLFVCLVAILGHELYANVLGRSPEAAVPVDVPGAFPAARSAPPKRGRGKKR
ncbi:MAG: hypothetical protein ABW252_06820 [Polyangiales bacterium]